MSTDALGPALIQSLVDNAIAESQHLEYKSQLPGNKGEDRMEFARDVASMANGGGGVMVFGVLDANEIAAKTTPVALGDETTRLQQIASAIIEPYLHLSFHEVKLSGDQGFIVIEIPDSPRRPFTVPEGPRLGYYMRSGWQRHPLTEVEVERMYRERFQLQADTQRRLDTLSLRMQQHPIAAERPVVYVMAAPALRRDRLFRPTDVETRSLRGLTSSIKEVERLGKGPISPLVGKVDAIFNAGDFGRIIPPIASTQFKSMVLREGRSSEAGWIEIHDDGAFVGAIPASLVMNERGVTEADGAQWIELHLIPAFLARIAAYWVLAVTYRITGEIYFRAGVAGGSEQRPARIVTGSLLRTMDGDCAVTENVETRFAADVSDFEIGGPLIRTAKVLLDDIFSAFCWPECYPLTPEGQINAQHVYREVLDKNVRPWANRVGVDIVGNSIGSAHP